MPKITLIGAGSVVFAKNLLSDILQFPELQDSTICLMDIDAARLRVAEVMTRKIIAKLGIRARVEATLDRRKAIRGAGFVICTIQVGGYKPGTVLDFEIPRKYGLLQTIGDTLGVGGIMRGLRTIPHLVEIARDIADVGAPGCVLLNYTNPMAMLCMAVDRAVGVPTVGLCHSVQHTSQQLASYLGLDFRHVTYHVAGINHMAFFLEFRYRGQDAYPLLFGLLEDPAFTQDRVRFEMMRRTGYFVTESSEHQSEYVPYFIHHGPDVVRDFEIPIDEYLRRCIANIASWKGTERALLGRGDDIDIPQQTHEYGGYIIHSLVTNKPRVIYGNMPNRGLITNLPGDCCVELPVLVDAAGLQPTRIGALPPQLAFLCQSNIQTQELTVAAALSGRRDHIYHAVMSDPHTAATLKLDQMWAMTDELIEAHQRAGLLGEFSPTIRNTGRALAGTGDRVHVEIEPAGTLLELGPRLAVKLRVRNDGASAFSAKIDFDAEGSRAKVAGGGVRVKVPAGRTVVKTLLFNTEPGAPRLTIAPRCADPRVIARDLRFVAPRVVEAGRDGTALEIRFADSAVFTGRLAVEGTTLRITGRVADTAVSIIREQPWKGSCIELFFRRRESNAQIVAWCVVPDNSAPNPVTREGRLVPGGSFRFRIGKRGYEMEGSIDLKAAGILEDAGHFYMDMIVDCSALGTAHGACRAGWNGRLDSIRQAGHYCLIKPA